MTVGAYVAKRRAAARLSIEDVALIFSDQERAAPALRAIEAGEIEPTRDDIETIACVVRLDVRIAARLLRTGEADVCTVCACSWHDACWTRKEGACWWVAADRCSHCKPPERVAA